VRPELQDVVDEVSGLLDQPMTLEDRSFNLVAFHSHENEIDDVRQRSILERKSTPEVRRWFESFGIATAHAPVRTPSSPDLGVLARLCLPARWKDVTYGYLWAIDEEQAIDEALLPSAMVLAERAAALMAQQARTREDLGFLLQDLLSTDPDTVEQAADEIHARRIIRRGVPVAAVELHLTRRPASGVVPMNLWTLPSSVIAHTGEDHTTLLVPLPGDDLAPAHDLARQARALYLERLPTGSEAELVAGIGAPRPDLAQLRGSWQQARLAARVLEGVPDRGPVAAWPELGIYRLLGCGPEGVLAEAAVDASVRRLLDEGSPELRETALTYLREGGNVQRTGAALNVHRQTVYYRLQRIEKVTGLDLSRGEDLLQLHLGLTLAPVLGLQPGSSDR
jgi:sugar diacid utilization regulator